jgi:hypothetical protein
LITRLRRLRELAVSRSGHITLVDSPAAEAVDPSPRPPEADRVAHDHEPVADYQDDEDRDLPDGNRRDDRPLEERRAEVAAAQRSSGAGAPDHRVAVEGEPDDAHRRRRSRRGGRRHRRHKAPAAP